jgi:hypothetical protein
MVSIKVIMNFFFLFKLGLRMLLIVVRMTCCGLNENVAVKGNNELEAKSSSEDNNTMYYDVKSS